MGPRRRFVTATSSTQREDLHKIYQNSCLCSNHVVVIHQFHCGTGVAAILIFSMMEHYGGGSSEQAEAGRSLVPVNTPTNCSFYNCLTSFGTASGTRPSIESIM